MSVIEPSPENIMLKLGGDNGMAIHVGHGCSYILENCQFFVKFEVLETTHQVGGVLFVYIYYHLLRPITIS